MNRSFIKPVILAIGCAALIACNNSPEKKDSAASDTSSAATDTTAQTVSTTPAATQQDYQYEPSESVVTGTLTTENFYGPPGFGENPKTDKKEDAWIFIPDQPVNVIATPQQTAADEVETKNNVAKIQLILPESIDGPGFKNKKVKVTGRFFGPHTGHHRTEVLLDVRKMDPL